MYQVYVVDDDRLILNEIIKTVPWLDNGFAVAGYSDDPQQAVPEILSVAPHVVFCDLRMPGMDGNEMIRLLREQNLGCEFVMLSAFGTFEDSRAFFLQEGFDYILKPLQQQEVQLVLERLSAKLALKIGPYPALKEGVTPAFAELILYVTKHYNQKHTLSDLGGRFQLSESYICNLFAKQYNSTLTRFITDLRMAEALRQMRDTRKAFKEIAIDCGYTDYYYFCKVFKERFGMSPTLYRQEHC